LAKDLDAWLRDAQIGSAADFAGRHPALFLLVLATGDDGTDIPFRTAMAGEGSGTGGLEVHPIEKSAQSPYRDRISIGRARNCDVVVRHKSVSKLHAHVRIDEAGAHTLTDVGSHNGTRVDGRILERDAPVPIHTGMHVRFGEVSGQVLDAPAMHAALMRLARSRG